MMDLLFKLSNVFNYCSLSSAFKERDFHNLSIAYTEEFYKVVQNLWTNTHKLRNFTQLITEQ